MNESYVKDWMSSEPVVVQPDTLLHTAHELMKEHSIRRLPVMDSGRLVGIVTLGDLREAGPSDATSLSIYELNYLLAQLSIKDIMTKHPKTISVDASLHDAAQLMLENKIGGLPVMEGEELAGIITESDIFRAVIEICV